LIAAAGRLVSVLVDLVYPKRCAGCSAFLPPRHPIEMCAACLDNLPWLTEPYCRICGDDFSVADPGDAETFADRICADCRRKRPAFSLARSAFKHAGAAREAVREFKFRGRRALSATLAHVFLRFLAGKPELTRGLDAVLCVPLHRNRERERGYNQAAELAKAISGPLSLPFLGGAVKRSRPTPPQVGLNRSDRIANVHGVFSVPDPGVIAGLSLLLVDDVMTTGSTASECARELVRAGAGEVRVATFARG